METYQKTPKIELHVHLEGSIPVEALYELIRKYGGDPAVRNLADLKSKFVYKDFTNFINVWSWKNKFLKEYDDFTFIAEKAAREFLNQNIRYAEMFISPSLFKKYHNLEVQKIVEAVKKGLDKKKAVKISLIVDLVRDYGPDYELITLYEINEVKNKGIIGIGIGGSENKYPPEPFTKLFNQARKFGFKTTAHAGEASGPESIWGAIHSLKVDRIGHGSTAYKDKNLMEWLSKNKLPVELCPLSNIKTGIFKNNTEYPILSFLEYDIPISINTDDPQMFNNSLSEEYQFLEDNFNLNCSDVLKIIDKSISTAWLEEEDKSILRNELGTG